MISRSANLRGSIAARLAFGYGLLVALSITAIIGVLYVGTVGVLEKSIDAKINAISARMLQRYRLGGETALQAEIAAQLADRVDTDSELLLLLSPQGRTIAGNLKNWTQRLPDKEEMSNTFLSRDGRQFLARFISHPLDGKGYLIIGRDMSELAAIRQVIERALLAGAAFSLMLAACGTWIFRRAIERRIGRIRLATTQIAAGDLTRRIEVQGDDEFARLNADINSMLDRIEELMEGVRHVSNSIAHDIRTPLSRVRARLENAVLTGNNLDSLAVATGAAIDDIDRLISMFDKLLQIAAAESGVGGASFQRLDLRTIGSDIVELYEPAAEAQGAQLVFSEMGPCHVLGDNQLIASALASLIDNALKYGGPGVHIDVAVRRDEEDVSLIVRDDGLGVPAADLPRLCERFYRVDRSRHLPGNGLGLSIVAAIARQHGARLLLTNACPGLEARLVFPAVRLNITGP